MPNYKSNILKSIALTMTRIHAELQCMTNQLEHIVTDDEDEPIIKTAPKRDLVRSLPARGTAKKTAKTAARKIADANPTGERVEKALSNGERILAYLAANIGSHDTREIAEATNIDNLNSLQVKLGEMYRKGLIRRVARGQYAAKK